MLYTNEQLRSLAVILAKTDALWDPCRADRIRCGDGIRSIHCRSATWQLRRDYERQGLEFLPPDRTSAGRMETQRLLASMASEKLISVKARAGRPAHVKLLPEGDRVARLYTGCPTLQSSAGFFLRMVHLLEDSKTFKCWKRAGHISEFAMIYPDGIRPWDEGGKVNGVMPAKNDIGEMLIFLAPWVSSGLVESHTTSLGHAYLKPTAAGEAYFAQMDLEAVDLDWVCAFHLEQDGVVAQFDSLDACEAVCGELRTLFNEQFQIERELLRTAVPKNLSELGEIAWSASE